MNHNIQVGYKNFNLSEQVSTYILIFFKVKSTFDMYEKNEDFLKNYST